MSESRGRSPQADVPRTSLRADRRPRIPCSARGHRVMKRIAPARPFASAERSMAMSPPAPRARRRHVAGLRDPVDVVRDAWSPKAAARMRWGRAGEGELRRAVRAGWRWSRCASRRSWSHAFMEQLIVPSTRLSGIDSIFVGLHWSETPGPRGSAESGLTAIDGRACRLGGAGPDVPFVEVRTVSTLFRRSLHGHELHHPLPGGHFRSDAGRRRGWQPPGRHASPARRAPRPGGRRRPRSARRRQPRCRHPPDHRCGHSPRSDPASGVLRQFGESTSALSRPARGPRGRLHRGQEPR